MEINRLGLCSTKIIRCNVAVWVFFQLLFCSSSQGFECLISDCVYGTGYKTNVQEMVGKELTILLLVGEGPQLPELSAGIFRVASCGDLIDSPASL